MRTWLRVGLVLVVVLLVAFATTVVLLASDCSPSTCGLWEPSDLQWWVFRCWRPPCEVIPSW